MLFSGASRPSVESELNVRGISRIAGRKRDHPVEGCIPARRDLAAFGGDAIQLRAVSELVRAQFLSQASDAAAKVFTAQFEWTPVVAYAPEGDVHVRVLRVEVDHRNPLEPRA